MKYGESTFDVLYLLFAVISGCLILRKASKKTQRLMGLAALLLGCGDAFHLLPRVLNYFVTSDFTAALGIGKLITSITMTVFYVMLYHIALDRYQIAEKRSVTVSVWILAAIRIICCLLPQNDWLHNSSDMTMGIIRNVPFTALGAIVCCLFFTRRKDDKAFSLMWVYILLSFLFYLPVAVGAGIVPMLGMLMLPKTVCYILMICIFLRVVGKEK